MLGLKTHKGDCLRDKLKEKSCLTCKICSKTFKSSIRLSFHEKSHSNGGMHQCPHCPKSFQTLNGVMRHYITHSMSFSFNCNRCDEIFEKKSKLDDHKFQAHAVWKKLYKCLVCQKEFGRKKMLQLHLETHEKKEEVADFKPPKPVCIICDYCGKPFNSRSALNRHIFIHNRYKPLYCSVCNKGFFKKESLDNHVASEHPKIQNKMESDVPIIKTKDADDSFTAFSRFSEFIGAGWRLIKTIVNPFAVVQR